MKLAEFAKGSATFLVVIVAGLLSTAYVVLRQAPRVPTHRPPRPPPVSARMAAGKIGRGRTCRRSRQNAAGTPGHTAKASLAEIPPTLARKRERECTFFLVAIKSNFIML
ncbi:hypothetical protein CQ14_29085 [Bradyrhizobium lablabi]|uniref:Uncharacterized protein n=1 Tax=Bradyrhizobium lablabi TaxID=722472 RepID=A0A0R3M7M5_9BRAD|nr:hypothetical protein [Bradyrhizobium lablabi]KRR15921.1 hypothetical protein CQ14_29085 [Bradyrhizobium lablabi]